MNNWPKFTWSTKQQSLCSNHWQHSLSGPISQGQGRSGSQGSESSQLWGPCEWDWKPRFGAPGNPILDGGYLSSSPTQLASKSAEDGKQISDLMSTDL